MRLSQNMEEKYSALDSERTSLGIELAKQIESKAALESDHRKQLENVLNDHAQERRD